MADLKTDYKNSAFIGNRKYQLINNPDGSTISFKDVTDYTNIGDDFGAEDINEINKAINELPNKDYINKLASQADNSFIPNKFISGYFNNTSYSSFNDSRWLYSGEYTASLSSGTPGLPITITSATRIYVKTYNTSLTGAPDTTRPLIIQDLFIPSLKRSWRRYITYGTTIDWGTWIEQNVVSSSTNTILDIIKLTQTEYDALTTKVATTLYVIVG